MWIYWLCMLPISQMPIPTICCTIHVCKLLLNYLLKITVIIIIIKRFIENCVHYFLGRERALNRLAYKWVPVFSVFNGCWYFEKNVLFWKKQLFVAGRYSFVDCISQNAKYSLFSGVKYTWKVCNYEKLHWKRFWYSVT